MCRLTKARSLQEPLICASKQARLRLAPVHAAEVVKCGPHQYERAGLVDNLHRPDTYR